METIKEIWYGIVDRETQKITAVFKSRENAQDYIDTYECVGVKVEQVRVTIDRIKTS